MSSTPSRHVRVGLRVYGATVQGGTPTPGVRRHPARPHPSRPSTRPASKAAINGFVAKGETPSPTPSKRPSVTSERPASATSSRSPTAGIRPDPCPVVQKLIRSRHRPQIDTVGFAVGDKAASNSSASPTSGRHLLRRRQRGPDRGQPAQAEHRAVREFAINGKPINGTPARPGHPSSRLASWVDTLTTGAKKHYLLKRSIPHSTMRVAVSARPAIDAARSKTTWKRSIPRAQARHLR